MLLSLSRYKTIESATVERHDLNDKEAEGSSL